MSTNPGRKLLGAFGRARATALLIALAIPATESPVSAQGSGPPLGPYNLKTREGMDLATGLYVYVLTARGDERGRACGAGEVCGNSVASGRRAFYSPLPLR